MGFEVPGDASDGVCFAENAGEALPRGEDSDGRLCCRGGLFGHTASVWRGSQERAVVRSVRTGEEGRRTAAIVAIAGLEAVKFVVDWEARDLQLLFLQAEHLVLNWGAGWLLVVAVDGFMCR